MFCCSSPFECIFPRYKIHAVTLWVKELLSECDNHTRQLMNSYYYYTLGCVLYFSLKGNTILKKIKETKFYANK